MSDPITDATLLHDALPGSVDGSSSASFSGDPLVMLEQLATEVRASRATLAASANYKFFCVVIPEEGPHTVTEFEDVTKLVGFLRELAASTKTHPVPPSVQIFRGERWGITKGPNRRLVEPGGRRVFPINYENDELDLDPTGAIS